MGQQIFANENLITNVTNITGSRVGWATNVNNALIGLRAVNNNLGEAAVKDVGTSSGNLVELDSAGDFPISVIPDISASKITSGTLSVSRGGTGRTSLSSLKSALSIREVPTYPTSNPTTQYLRGDGAWATPPGTGGGGGGGNGTLPEGLRIIDTLDVASNAYNFIYVKADGDFSAVGGLHEISADYTCRLIIDFGRHIVVDTSSGNVSVDMPIYDGSVRNYTTSNIGWYVTVTKDTTDSNRVSVDCPSLGDIIGNANDPYAQPHVTGDYIYLQEAGDTVTFVLADVTDETVGGQPRTVTKWYCFHNLHRSKLPPLPTSNQSTQYLRGDGTWATVSGGSATTNASLLTSGTLPGARLTSTTSNRLVPTLPNNTTTFLRGDGTFATPAGGSASIPAGLTTLDTLDVAANRNKVLWVNDEGNFAAAGGYQQRRANYVCDLDTDFAKVNGMVSANGVTRTVTMPDITDNNRIGWYTIVTKDENDLGTVRVRMNSAGDIIGADGDAYATASGSGDFIDLLEAGDSVTCILAGYAANQQGRTWWFCHHNLHRSKVPVQPSSNQSTQFLRGDLTWATPPAGSATTSASDLTSGTLPGARLTSTSSTRLVPTLPTINATAQFLRGDGTFATPTIATTNVAPRITNFVPKTLAAGTNHLTADMINTYLACSYGSSATRLDASSATSRAIGIDGDKIIIGNAGNSSSLFVVEALRPTGLSERETIARWDTIVIHKIAGKWYYTSEANV